MKVILNTGKKNLFGLNGRPVSVKEIVDRRVSVVVPQSILDPKDRRGTAATRVIDFVPSDVVEYVGAQDFTVEAAEEIAADFAANKEDYAAVPDLFTQQDPTEVAQTEEAAETAEATAATTKAGRKNSGN